MRASPGLRQAAAVSLMVHGLFCLGWRGPSGSRRTDVERGGAPVLIALVSGPISPAAAPRRTLSEGDFSEPAGRRRAASTPAPAGAWMERPPGGPKNPAPVYPPAARRQGWEGEVMLAARVEPDGRVARVEVHRSCGHPALDRAALEAVRNWRFEPAAPGERSQTVWIPVDFRLEKPEDK